MLTILCIEKIKNSIQNSWSLRWEWARCAKSRSCEEFAYTDVATNKESFIRWLGRKHKELPGTHSFSQQIGWDFESFCSGYKKLWFTLGDTANSTSNWLNDLESNCSHAGGFLVLY